MRRVGGVSMVRSGSAWAGKPEMERMMDGWINMDGADEDKKPCWRGIGCPTGRIPFSVSVSFSLRG